MHCAEKNGTMALNLKLEQMTAASAFFRAVFIFQSVHAEMSDIKVKIAHEISIQLLSQNLPDQSEISLSMDSTVRIHSHCSDLLENVILSSPT